jgi:hypothetical protein
VDCLGGVRLKGLENLDRVRLKSVENLAPIRLNAEGNLDPVRLKGEENTAQGNALGIVAAISLALKGRDNWLHRTVTPLPALHDGLRG